MTIDERIEALTVNLELATADIQHLRSIAETTTTDIQRLKGIADTTLDSIKSLERIALSHETRITEIEEGR
jgi:hypothetical protein